MGKFIDVDAFLDDVAERYCKDCERRKGIKNGKKKFIYDIGDAPCRACEVDDMKYELESAPTVDAVPVVRCKECKFASLTYDGECKYCQKWKEKHDGESVSLYLDGDFYCAFGERKEDA